MKKNVNNQGFTVLELIIALAIIGISSAIVLPSLGIVQRNRINSMASQLSMDIQKLRTYARTYDNPALVPGVEDYKYRMVFTGLPVEYEGEEYYKYYVLDGDNLIVENEQISDDIVLMRAVYGTNQLIKEIQFDEKGRIYIKDDSDVYKDWIDLTGYPDKKIKIFVTIDGFDLIKQVHVNPLTAKTLITE